MHGSIQLHGSMHFSKQSNSLVKQESTGLSCNGNSNFSKEAQSTPQASQPLPRLGERCLGARWEMAFLQHVLGQPKGPLHVRHAQNTCTMGCRGDTLNLCSNHLCWLILIQRTKSSNISLLHVWAPHLISKTSMFTQPLDHYLPSLSQETDWPVLYRFEWITVKVRVEILKVVYNNMNFRSTFRMGIPDLHVLEWL